MEDHAYRMAMLFDFYGEMLTPRQKELFDLYYNEDLSLAEIGENTGITRQGVRDSIVRAEAILTEMEEKTGMIARFLEVRRRAEEIAAAAGEINELNGRLIHNDRIRELASAISAAAETLKE